MTRPIVGHETANAKINLALHVLGRDPDGYHQLDSLVCFAAIADQLTIELSESDGLEISGPFGEGFRGDDNNLVMRALAAFRAKWPNGLGQGVHLRLTKNLPIAAGIGGGSADAAAALRLFASVAETPAAHDALVQLAATLGSDIPVCLKSQPSRMQGRGEKIAAAPAMPQTHVVLVNPRIPSATQEVFQNLAKRENPPLPELPPSFSGLQNLADWLAHSRNDLEQPATELVPQIGEITHFMSSIETCAFARLSGSGATVFGLFENQSDASHAVALLTKHFPEYWIAEGRLLV